MLDAFLVEPWLPWFKAEIANRRPTVKVSPEGRGNNKRNSNN
jgi:hypothetical protein